MKRIVEHPPTLPLLADGSRIGGWWHAVDDDRIVCDLCPRECHLKEGDRGFCFVRENREGEMVLTTYGRSTGFCVDPIEKKPLNHFHPGTAVLSFGTAGCNLGCKFCQNWTISKSREIEQLSATAGPRAIAEAAQTSGCRSVAFTYNDPVIWAEYAMDVADACHERDIKTVAVTAGYITEVARGPFFRKMDAANVDLKAFTEDFYHRITSSHLQPIMDTLVWLRNETDVWFEITNLIIPDANDSTDELQKMCDWIVAAIGGDVPVHFSAFHPDFRMQDRPRTPHETLIRAYDIAKNAGLQFVYVGNVDDVQRHSTYCPKCGNLLIQRNWYELGTYELTGNACNACGATIAGHFDSRPGNWGRKRLPIQIRNDASLESGKTNMAEPTTVATSLDLSSDQETAILSAARETITNQVMARNTVLTDEGLAGVGDSLVMGVFVTVKRAGHLRGCCGTLGQPMPLSDALQHAAERTATADVRFPSLNPTELPFLSLDVTLLYGFQTVTEQGNDRADAVEIGRHGLQIRQGENSGLLLPSVAVEHQLDAQAFLRQVCRKAGLSVTAWKDETTELQTFEGQMIEGQMDAPELPKVEPRPLLSNDELSQLAEHCRTNIRAMAIGATPNYYVSGCWDGNVQGICIAVNFGEQTGQWSRFSLRPGMPLQATLMNLIETAAKSIGGAAQGSFEVSVAVLSRPAMHGSVAHPDLRGFDPASQAMLILEGQRTAMAFDPSKSAEEVFQLARDQADVAVPDGAGLFSLDCFAGQSSILFSNAPQAQVGQANRPPTVAGTFYPADMNELWSMVDGFMQPSESREAVPAVMVPHAGLKYSGSIAGQVFGRVKIPDTVIVIGPKHTRHGVPWAVAANETWQMPWGKVDADPELAKKLVEKIPRLQLDDAAHFQEHSIEVELPFIARANPNARVVGIVMGNAGLDHCLEIATGLAEVIKEMEVPPLLVISSDMNHYASDEENRRLDEIAMTALESTNPQTIFDQVTGNAISMCGVLPAITVVETLRQLDQLSQAKRVAYATSADVSGDTSRVVGYSGMMFC